MRAQFRRLIDNETGFWVKGHYVIRIFDDKQLIVEIRLNKKQATDLFVEMVNDGFK